MSNTVNTNGNGKSAQVATQATLDAQNKLVSELLIHFDEQSGEPQITSSEHLQVWRDSGVDDRITQASIYSEDDDYKIGRALGAKYNLGSGYFIKSLNLATMKKSKFTQFRPDEPEVDKKYLSIRGTKADMDAIALPVSADIVDWNVVKSDVNIPVWLCEGAKKAGCIMTVFKEPALALPGVWNFKRKNKSTDAKATVIVSNLEQLMQPGRTFYIAYDADMWIKPEIIGAAIALGDLLEKAGCNVKVVQWELTDDTKGFDDFYMHVGEERAKVAKKLAQNLNQFKNETVNKIPNYAYSRLINRLVEAGQINADQAMVLIQTRDELQAENDANREEKKSYKKKEEKPRDLGDFEPVEWANGTRKLKNDIKFALYLRDFSPFAGKLKYYITEDSDSGQWRFYADKKWKNLSTHALIAEINQWIQEENKIRVANPNPNDLPWETSAGLIRGALNELTCDPSILIREDEEPNLNLIPFNNGVLNLITNELQDFCKEDNLMYTLPYDYQPLEGVDASNILESMQRYAPKIYKFLYDAQEGDKHRILQLVAFMSAALRGDSYKYQRYLNLRGVQGSGKGVFIKLIERMIGKENSVPFSVNSIFKPDTASAICRSRLAFAPDQTTIHVGDKSGNGDKLEVFLQLVAGEEIGVEKKYKGYAKEPAFRGSFILASNYPIFTGKTEGIPRREVISYWNVRVDESKRSHQFELDVLSEADKMVYIALQMSPKEAEQYLRGIEGKVSPVSFIMGWESRCDSRPSAAFVDEMIIQDSKESVTVAELYEKAKQFYTTSGYGSFAKVRNTNEVCADLEYLKIPFERTRTNKGNIIKGIRLRGEGENHTRTISELLRLSDAQTLDKPTTEAESQFVEAAQELKKELAAPTPIEPIEPVIQPTVKAEVKEEALKPEPEPVKVEKIEPEILNQFKNKNEQNRTLTPDTPIVDVPTPTQPGDLFWRNREKTVIAQYLKPNGNIFDGAVVLRENEEEEEIIYPQYLGHEISKTFIKLTSQEILDAQDQGRLGKFRL